MTSRPWKLFLCAVLVLVPLAMPAQSGISVTIESISANKQITGKVIGLMKSAQKNYKVVVYLKTDQWYVHPYKDSSATIESGSWTLSTQKRDHNASTIAALVVGANDVVPSPTNDVNNIPCLARKVKELEGTPDFGKL